jgi:hypothetical protein
MTEVLTTKADFLSVKSLDRTCLTLIMRPYFQIEHFNLEKDTDSLQPTRDRQHTAHQIHGRSTTS